GGGGRDCTVAGGVGLSTARVPVADLVPVGIPESISDSSPFRRFIETLYSPNVIFSLYSSAIRASCFRATPSITALTCGGSIAYTGAYAALHFSSVLIAKSASGLSLG